MSAAPNSGSGSGTVTPDQLRQLVLDYLCHSCYTETARAFKRASTVRQLDADGDEVIQDASGSEMDMSVVGAHAERENFEDQLRQTELRNEIRTHIMSGRVDEATAMLETHFPTVLSEDPSPPESDDPRPPTNNTEYVSSTSTESAHLNLNLRILAFSEACRTVPLPYPPVSSASTSTSASKDDTPTSSPTSTSTPHDAMITDSTSDSSAESYEKQVALLQRAQKLYAYSLVLPNPADRATYMKELENVGGLLAYKVPEKSSMAKYLTLERREAVADQVGRAILKRTGRPVYSSLEILTRHTQVLWDSAREYNAKARVGAVLPPLNANDNTNGSNIPAFDLPTFLDSRP